MDKAVKTMSMLVDTVIREAQEHIDRERKCIVEAKTLADTAASDEIARLKDQNSYLAQLLQTERAKSERAKDELIKRISGLLGDFVSERDRSLRESFADVSEGNEKTQSVLTDFNEEHAQRVDGVVSRGQEWSVGLEKKAGENKRLRDGSLKVKSSQYLKK
jgi:kinesin family member 11